MIRTLSPTSIHPVIVAAFVVTHLAMFSALAEAQADLADYAVPPGHALEVDAYGFQMPTAIAFVPNPGTSPDAPLYFVAELTGTIKVVTVDRSVHTFAQVPAARDQTPALQGASQSGLAGMCLDTERGYVFATYTEADAGGVLRNRMVRFRSTPGSFDLEAHAVDAFDAMLQPFQSAPAHQIGTCVVENGQVYVGVGDGGNATAASDVDVLLGKVLCLDVHGEPCRDNPYFESGAALPDGTFPPEAYVHAYGFRNPFGLVWVGGQLYAAENGVDLDRFLPVRRGEDHMWRGTDQSLTVLADLVFVPTVAPVQTIYLPPDADFVGDDWRDRFVSAVFGGKGTNSGVIAYAGVTSRRPPDVPRYLLEFLGEPGTQHFSAVAIGPDGVYTAPMVPDAKGGSPVLRIRLDPETAHTVHVSPRASLESTRDLGVLGTHGCVSCHTIRGVGGGVGPSLDAFGLNWRLTQRLNAPAYEAQVARVDAIDAEPFRSWRDARQEVLEARGIERTWVWLKHYLQEPRFDRPETLMPNLGLSSVEAEALRTQLFHAANLKVPGARETGLWQRGLAYLRANVLHTKTSTAARAVLAVAATAALALLLTLLVRRERSASRA